MNFLLFGTIIFVIIYLFLNWFAKTSSKKIAHFLKRLAVLMSVVLAIILSVAGKFIFSLPFLLILNGTQNKRTYNLATSLFMEIGKLC